MSSSAPDISWTTQNRTLLSRPEFELGTRLLQADGERAFLCFTVARWACIPFSLIAASVCYRWALHLYGLRSAIVALTLWCFSPTVLGNAQLITPDTGAAAFGVSASFFFWCWLKQPTWTGTAIAGIMLGLAQLTKMTWVVLFLLWPALWLAWRWNSRREVGFHGFLGQMLRLAVVFLVALYVINLGYAFEGTGRRLGDFRFVSETFAKPKTDGIDVGPARNRFAGTSLGDIRIPLPASYVLGIDRQKHDFEDGFWSYLRGEWRHGGWWYYYLYALAIKVPLGTWILVVLATGVALLRRGYAASPKPTRSSLRSSEGVSPCGYSTGTSRAKRGQHAGTSTQNRG